MKTALFILLISLLPALAPLLAEVPSGYRRALLVGNSKYAGQALSVGKSLDRVEKALRALGFEVTRRENLGDKAQKAAVDEFALGVPTNGIAVFYFLGLGAHVERQGKLYNLLRPVGDQRTVIHSTGQQPGLPSFSPHLGLDRSLWQRRQLAQGVDTKSVQSSLIGP